jgi:hypothetical protein
VRPLRFSCRAAFRGTKSVKNPGWSSSAHVRRLLSRGLKARATPIIHFELDRKTARTREVDELLDRIRRERQERERGAAAPGAAEAPEGAPLEDTFPDLRHVARTRAEASFQ